MSGQRLRLKNGSTEGIPSLKHSDVSNVMSPAKSSTSSSDDSVKPTRPKSLRDTWKGVRGSQYVSIKYSERLAEAGIEPSVGSKRDSYDNALAETINGLYKAELIHRRAPWETR
jgi:transposase InsO family protein